MTPNLATMLREAGLRGRLQGQVAPDPPAPGRRAARRLGPARRRADRARLRLRRLGGPRRRRERQGGELRRRQRRADGRGWDEVYTRQVERWLGRPDLPEPFCLVVSLVNPHDVLGYPASYLRGGYAADEFRDLGVELPPTVDEDLRDKPSVHALMRMGMAAYLGPARNRARRSSTTSTSTPICTAWSTRRSAACSPRSATPTTRARCAPERSSSAAPTTARWASPTAACARRRSTPTRRRSTSRWWSPTRSCSRSRARPTRSPRWSTSLPTLATARRAPSRRRRRCAGAT